MCGRYAVTSDPARIAMDLDAIDETVDVREELDVPGYNVAPTTRVVALVSRHSRSEPDAPAHRRLRAMRWGLVPSWQKSLSGPPLFNARAESAGAKPAFRTALATKRALVPMDGWYEWRTPAGTGTSRRKQPFFMTPHAGPGRHEGGRPHLLVAGLWSVWHDPSVPPGPDAGPLLSCTVLTTESVGALRDIHDRMPLVLPGDAADAWLDPDGPVDPELLAPPSPDLVRRIEIRPVGDLVSNVRNDGPELLRRVDDPGDSEQLSLI
ncbi:SOS response-associated peptidase [Tsukamurella sp. 8F]|uniref:SOS response-associated peptidase n=1 Tax=unclassified Tsukamurella TaxID=2633480 RepID=UPI0023B901F0|nr:MULTISPECIES: SOS response-associated peptidase [unclassified Tsukamurella]MDF0529079.1 SOS response-associated peptidase [Tsukamurella sp. 8J]MDF0587453.1 SOS response-associated peptidase [Tsukamurella sp. 8F]